MRKRKRTLQPLDHTYSEQQLTGLRAHAQAQKQSTVDRLRTAIAALEAQHKSISASTIREECGLAYASVRRNAEALLLYQQHSAFLKRERKRTPDSVSRHSACTIVVRTSAASRIVAKDTKNTPSAKSCWATRVTSSARRVLPTPPIT